MTYSKNELRLPRVALLETRMGPELANLVRKHGGYPVIVPSVREYPADASTDVARFIDRLCDNLVDVVVFQTGVSVTQLVRTAESLGRATGLFAGLRKVTKVCRGPKPVHVLRQLGLGVDILVPEPHTTGEMIETVSSMAIDDLSMTVIHHGERNTRFVEAIAGRPKQINELVLYRWEIPEDTRPLWTLTTDLIAGRYDAIAFTSQVQARHLFQIAEQSGLDAELRQALKDRVIVACVGPTCSQELRNHGIEPDVEPEHPKMGHMVRDLAILVAIRAGDREGALV